MFIHPGTLNPYPPNMVQLLHKRVLEHAGLDRIRFETLRHTCVIRAIEDGHDVRTLSAKLGHSRPVTTRRSYSDCLPQAQEKTLVCAACKPTNDQQKAADRLSNLLHI